MGDTSEATPQTSSPDYMGMAIEEALRGACGCGAVLCVDQDAGLS